MLARGARAPACWCAPPSSGRRRAARTQTPNHVSAALRARGLGRESNIWHETHGGEHRYLRDRGALRGQMARRDWSAARSAWLRPQSPLSQFQRGESERRQLERNADLPCRSNTPSSSTEAELSTSSAGRTAADFVIRGDCFVGRKGCGGQETPKTLDPKPYTRQHPHGNTGVA